MYHPVASQKSVLTDQIFEKGVHFQLITACTGLTEMISASF
jgi:hypothetical protein